MASSNIIRLAVLSAAAAGLVTYGIYYWNTGRWLEKTDNAYLRADISAITPRVAGEVVEVLVRDNQLLKQGDVMLRIDARDYEARLASARASVAQAEAALVGNQRTQEMQMAMIEEASAVLAAAQADSSRSRKEFERADALVRDGVATTARLDVATAAAKSADAAVTRGQAAVKAARTQTSTLLADRARLEAQLEGAKAAETLAALDLEATVIRAPVSGRVGDLSVKQGERVTPGRRLLSLVSADSLWVEANYKETQLTHVRVGQPVTVHVDAFPDETLHGKVDSVSPASGAEFALLPADNATGNFTKIVQRIPVRVMLELEPALRERLRPGMSVEVVVDTQPGV